MKRSLSILTGPEAGRTVMLDGPLFTVGRSGSSTLHLDDPQVSRLHLELSLQEGRTLAEDKSSRGSTLNGNRWQGAVVLKSADILELGQIQLRYEEEDEVPAVVSDDLGPLSSGMSGTKFMERLEGAEGDEPGQEATRAIVGEQTRMLNPADLPKWKAPAPSRFRSRSMVLLLLLAAGGLLLAVAAFWWGQGPSSGSVSGASLERYTDPVHAFSISYPDSWVRYLAKPDVPLSAGFGKPEDRVWVKMRVLVDRGIPYETMGLTEGFSQYLDAVKSQYTLLGSKPMVMNDIACVFYGFTLKGVQGKGIYLLNGGTKIIVECTASLSAYPQHAELFTTLLRSLSLSGEQQTLDFPLPDEAIQKKGLADPGLPARLMAEHKRCGDALVERKEVKPDNLYHAVQEYKTALQWSRARPERVPGYQAAAYGLRTAMTLYNQAIERQRYEISRAQKEGDRETAYWAAHKLLQMLPDKTDAIYQETYQLVRQLSLEK